MIEEADTHLKHFHARSVVFLFQASLKEEKEKHQRDILTHLIPSLKLKTFKTLPTLCPFRISHTFLSIREPAQNTIVSRTRLK